MPAQPSPANLLRNAGFSFFQRLYPSANAVLLHGGRPVLVDSGFGSDTDALVDWLHAQGVSPDKLSLVVNTHHHSDHVGGNHRLHHEFGVPIAAHRWEADLVNRRDREACSASWLQQPVEPYTVAWPLRDGDVIDTGDIAWHVIETAGHTLGHISLHAPTRQVAVLGDAVHDGDTGWLSPFREGTACLSQSLETLEKLAGLRVEKGFSGHGGPIYDVAQACATATARLQRWRDAPEAMAWHACKRIFAHALIVADGLTEAEILARLPTAPWFQDHAIHAFASTPAAFAPRLIAEMLRSKAAVWRDGKLLATADYTVAGPGWQTAPGLPADWK